MIHTLTVTALLLVGAPVPQTDAREELKKFQGTWKLKAANFMAEEKSPEERMTAQLVVTGDRFVLTLGAETYRGTFTVDPTRRPKTIEVAFTEGEYLKGKTVLGIYETDGDTRKSCFAAPEQERPADFAAGPNRFVWTWQRDRP